MFSPSIEIDVESLLHMLDLALHNNQVRVPCQDIPMAKKLRRRMYYVIQFLVGEDRQKANMVAITLDGSNIVITRRQTLSSLTTETPQNATP